MSWTRRLILPGRCVLAGLCIAASVPPWGWWPLAFVGIALLDRLIADQPWKRRFRRTWLVGRRLAVPRAVLDLGPHPAGLRGRRRPLRGLLRGGRRPLPTGSGALAGAARPVPAGRGGPLDLPLRGRAARDPGHEPGRGARWARPPACWAAYLVVVLVVAGGVALSAAWERDWKVAGGIAHVARGALRRRAGRAPRATTSGRSASPSCRAAARSTRRAADTDPREVFERHLEASKLVTQPVDLVLWPENVVAVEGRLSDNKESTELSHLAAGAEQHPGHRRDRGDHRHPLPQRGHRLQPRRLGRRPLRQGADRAVRRVRAVPGADREGGRRQLRVARARRPPRHRPGDPAHPGRHHGRGHLLGGLLPDPGPRRHRQRRRGAAQPDQRLVLLARPSCRASRSRRPGCGPSRPAAGPCRPRPPASRPSSPPTAR